MDNVKIHDNYIHDTISEGVYLGSTQAQPQHKFRNLEFYNNRLIRTGTEIGQFGNLADGSRIHHNVFLLGALDWKNPFQQYQDNGIQLGHREGSMSFDHNIVIGAASSGMILFNNDVAGDVHDPSDLLTINNNYFAYSRNRGVYIHSASDGIKQVEFRDNHFSEIVFTFDEVYPGSTNGMRIINSANNDNPISLTDNVFEGQAGQSFYAGGGNITANNNSNQPVNDIQFNHQRWPGGGDYFALEIWTAEDINGQPVSYVVGDLVLHQSQIYEAQQDINYLNDPHLSPDQSSSDTWLPKPPMADDVRQVEKAEFAHIGLLDLVSDLIFESGFD